MTKLYASPKPLHLSFDQDFSDSWALELTTVLKSVDSGGGPAGGELAALDRRIRSGAEIRRLPLPAHYRAMIGTAWRLGALPELAELRLRRAAHQLGYRGPVLSRSVAYSTTLTALRGVRRTCRAEQGRRYGADRLIGGVGAGPDLEVESGWEYQRSGSGSDADAMLARGIRAGLQANREAAREGREAADDEL